MSSTAPQLPYWLKYVITSALAIALSVVEYLATQNYVISGATLGTVLVIVLMAVLDDFDSTPQATAPAATAKAEIGTKVTTATST